MFIYAIVQRYFSANRRAVQNTVLYAVIGLAGLSAIFIITAGVYIRRMRRWVLVWFHLPPRNAPSPIKNVLPDGRFSVLSILLFGRTRKEFGTREAWPKIKFL